MKPWCGARLACLQVPFHKAELLSTHSSPDLTTRLQQLRAAHDAYWQYLQRCHQYGFLKGSVADAYAAEEAGAAPDPGTARNHRIERFKRSKAVNGLLQQLKSRCKVADEEVRAATPQDTHSAGQHVLGRHRLHHCAAWQRLFCQWSTALRLLPGKRVMACRVEGCLCACVFVVQCQLVLLTCTSACSRACPVVCWLVWPAVWPPGWCGWLGRGG